MCFQFHALKCGRRHSFTRQWNFLSTKNSRSKRGCLTFKSWAHIKSHIKCWSHVGSVERAAIILHTDSSSPYGDHRCFHVCCDSAHGWPLLLSATFCFMFLKWNPAASQITVSFLCLFSLIVSPVLIQLNAVYAADVWLQQLGFSCLYLLLSHVLFLIILHIIAPHPSHGCLYRVSGPW